MNKQDWQYKKLGDVVKVTMGQSPDSSSYNDNEEGLPFFQGCSDFGLLYPTITTYCSAPNKIAEPFDVLMSVRAPVGTLNISNVKCCIGRGLVSFRQIKNISSYKYIYYFLKSAQEDFQNKSTGATFKAIGKELIVNYPIIIPPVSIQEQIVSELDGLNSIIEKRKSQYTELDNLTLSIFYDMFGDPIANEKNWNIVKIGDISAVKTGPFGSMLHKEDYIQNGIPLVNPMHMIDFKIVADDNFTISKDKAEELSNYILKKNDIIFARRGDIGRCAIVTDREVGYLCGTGSLLVRFDTEIKPTYIMYVVRSKSFKSLLTSQAKGATMLNLNSGIISDLQIPVPPLHLQQSFAEKIEEIEAMKAKILQSLKESENLFNSRMDYYFS